MFTSIGLNCVGVFIILSLLDAHMKQLLKRYMDIESGCLIQNTCMISNFNRERSQLRSSTSPNSRVSHCD